MDGCIFCRIVRGEIPAMKVFEDDQTCAFMDIAGDVDGHMLIIPKKHVESILDCDAETLSRLMETARRLARHLVHVCGYEGVNLLNASGACAGQSVPHFHIHIIPRKPDDGVDAWPALPGARRSIDDAFEELRMD